MHVAASISDVGEEKARIRPSRRGGKGGFGVQRGGKIGGGNTLFRYRHSGRSTAETRNPAARMSANLPGARLDRSPSAPPGSGLRRNDDSSKGRGLGRRQQIPCEHPITPRADAIRRAGDVRREIVVGAVGGGGLADDGPDLFQIG